MVFLINLLLQQSHLYSAWPYPLAEERPSADKESVKVLEPVAS
jgi:hypothetical protein